ncbi:MAG: HAMP domain-containing protein [Deltaproteobacteria bacterium]|nr:HAMP domain-containing protein [Deltaproteobacteria bacterium]
MKKSALGIRTQLIIGTVLLTSAGIGLVGLMSIKAVEMSAVYAKMDSAERLVKVLNAAARSQYATHGDKESTRAAGALLKEAGINDFEFTDGKGVVFQKEGTLPEHLGAALPFAGEIIVKRVGGGILSGPGEALHVIAFFNPGSGSGRLRFAVSLKGVAEEMSGIRNFLLAYVLLDSLIIIITGLYFFSRLVVGPIKRLEVAATRIASGNFGERAEVGDENEIGSLANSFNIMAERLESKINALERLNAELIAAQAELLKTSTLAAVGNLAAGIAHEVGNPLGAVRGYVDILAKGGLEKDEEAAVIKRASAEITRIDAIVREFLEVARPSKPTGETVEVNRLIEEIISTVAVQNAFDGVKIIFEPDGYVPPVIGDEGKLRQVFMNILLNAAHSLSCAGVKTITVKTYFDGHAETAERAKSLRRRKDDQMFAASTLEKRCVFVEFSDNGRGIAQDDLPRIFDPFFTTKEVGKGTGLGLFVSRAIIKAYGGEITVESNEGEGAIFTVALPARAGDKGDGA